MNDDMTTADWLDENMDRKWTRSGLRELIRETVVLPKIDRIQVAAIQPDDLVILHCDHLEASEIEHLKEAWERATELPNKVVVVTGGLEVEVQRPGLLPQIHGEEQVNG